MKFANYLTSIEGVAIYPIISLVLFVSVFVFIVVYIYTRDKKSYDEDAKIPLS